MSLFGIFKRHHTPAATPISRKPMRPAGVAFCRDTLGQMDWHAFEQLAVLYFENLGIRTAILDNNDRTGCTFQLFHPSQDNPYALVKCLSRASHDQDVHILDSFASIAQALGITRCIALCNHSASPELRGISKETSCKLLDLDAFWEQIFKLDPERQRPLQAFVREQEVFAPYCPDCALPLRERVARTGQRFAACPNFPRCQYTPLQAQKSKITTPV